MAPCESFKAFDRLVQCSLLYCVRKYAKRGLYVHDNALLIQELGEDDVHYTPPGVWPARLGLSSGIGHVATCNQRIFSKDYPYISDCFLSQIYALGQT